MSVSRVRSQLANFFNNASRGLMRNQWLVDPQLSIYVRYSKRCFDKVPKKFTCTLDLANINSEHPGRGHFTNFLDFAEASCPWDYIYVENVLTDRFAAFWERRGYTRLPCNPSNSSIGAPPCFYKQLYPIKIIQRPVGATPYQAVNPTLQLLGTL